MALIGHKFPPLYLLNVDWTKKKIRVHTPQITTADLEGKVKLIAYAAREMIEDESFFSKIVPIIREQAAKATKEGR